MSALTAAQVQMFDALDEQRELRWGGGTLTIKAAGEHRTRAWSRTPRLDARRLHLDEIAARAQAQDQRLGELGLL